MCRCLIKCLTDYRTDLGRVLVDSYGLAACGLARADTQKKLQTCCLLRQGTCTARIRTFIGFFSPMNH
jgi:hypothetical protein